MNNTFDIAAVNYDEVFTNSHIGKLQRNLVQDYLTKTIPKNRPLRILEINCGTGEDALWLAQQGHQVLATDISLQMINVAKEKQSKNSSSLQFRQLDINDLGKVEFQENFDLIFSDFGGLNCLSSDQLKVFLKSASKKLCSGGRIIAVIMPKHCILESSYFLLKGKFKKAFRRNTEKAIEANVENSYVSTWYYNPKNIESLSKQIFKVDQKYPIGFMIPPSYLETFFSNKLSLLKILNKLDKTFKHFSFLSKYSDHYIISLSKI